MSESSTLTQCPHCQTRFRVTESQLQVAAGKVRCGHCMKIFNARDNALRDDSVPESPPTPPEPSPEPPKKEAAGQEEADAANGGDEDLVFADDPEEDQTDRSYAGSSLRTDEFSDSFLALDRDPTDEAEEQAEEVDESWAEAILDEDPKDTAPAREAPPRHGESDRSAFQPAPRPEPQTEPGLRADREERAAQATAPPRQHLDYRGLKATPVGTGRTPRRWPARVLWTLLVLALLAGAVYQAGWREFDRLARIPELRPLYEQACQWLECTLPPMVALDQIESRKLVVRSDPDSPRALRVEAILVNQARFAQPFPAIALTFSNLNNDIVAQRVFRPDEYLAGEASDWQTLPPDTPVRIGLSIKDPGKDAINYNIRFYPNPQGRK